MFHYRAGVRPPSMSSLLPQPGSFSLPAGPLSHLYQGLRPFCCYDARVINRGLGMDALSPGPFLLPVGAPGYL
jgi:hypothetical protein